MKRSEWIGYATAGALCGYLIGALLFFDNRLSLASSGFAKLGFYLAVFYALAGLAGGGLALLGWRVLRRWGRVEGDERAGRQAVFAGLFLFVLLFFWNFDSFYHHSTFEFGLLVWRLLTESFVPVTAEGALNLGILLLLVATSAALAWALLRLRAALPAGRWQTLCRVLLAAGLLVPWGVEAARSLADRETPPPLLARPGRRILFIGIDALDWKIAGELLAAGELPHLQALAARGAAAPLETYVPAYSPMVWTTIATGREIPDHNIRHFSAYGLGGAVAVQPLVEPSLLLGNPYVLRVFGQLGLVQPGSVTSNTRRAPAFWELASHAGLNTAVLGWWASAPAEPLNGIMVSDYATHTDLSAAALEAQVYPPTARSMVAAELQAARQPPREWLEQLFALTPEQGALLKDQGPDAAPPAMREILHSLQHDSGLLAIAKSILHAGQPELLAVYLEGLDTVGHMALHYWLSADPASLDPAELATYHQTAKAYYRLVDAWVGELCGLVTPDTYVFIVSDHGFTLEGPPNYFHHKSGPPGVILLSGPGVLAGSTPRAHVRDITPTLLYLLGMPVAGEMEGRVLEEALAPEFRGKYPLLSVPSYAGYRSAR
ncbi:MAG: alkaline phosphatase family protein [Candidatus Latescibacteria bacterium]|nr:alkaline phosphatase family protein [Candidatus Latescibacterota bacterium]